ncbi:MAG: ABC transporter ATP-binding protein [Candidatus Promineifilaceae bacterium]|nr:ABC transporter ATP-binding protein [Candidatus Promineifilaceae bacterium]
MQRTVKPPPLPSLRLLLRCYSYLRPYWRTVAGEYLFILFITALNVAIPQFIRVIVDRVVAQPAEVLQGESFLGTDLSGEADLLLPAVAALLALTLLKGIFTYFQGKWSEVASQSVAYDVRNDLQNALTRLPFAYHDRAQSGQLLSRALRDVEYIRFLTGRATLRLVEMFVLFLATGAVLVWMNRTLALLALLALPIIAVIGLRVGLLYRPLSLARQEQLGELTTQLEQNLRGARVVKAFAQEPAEIGRFDAENESWFDLAAAAARLESVNLPLLDLIANLALVAVLLYGGLLTIGGETTLGELVAFTTYLGQLTAPVRRFGMVVSAIAMASSSAERVFAIIDAPVTVADGSGPPPEKVRGEVRFENVSFAYEGSQQILHDISLTARPGEIVALLGATGAGKSTVTNLIPRLYDPTSGRITLDGHDIRGLPLEALRREIGIVLQETTLFARTVRENIAYGRPDATEEEIVAAARAAQAHDFIVRDLPDGYDTIVGEQGATLSGGQKQRLAIAHALLTDPRILILDDATASVDVTTERRIQKALDRLMEGRTTFVIAHRLSTVRRADQILLLEQGRITARGTHEELLEQSPLYRDIYERQLAQEAPGAADTERRETVR